MRRRHLQMEGARLSATHISSTQVPDRGRGRERGGVDKVVSQRSNIKVKVEYMHMQSLLTLPIKTEERSMSVCSSKAQNTKLS